MHDVVRDFSASLSRPKDLARHHRSLVGLVIAATPNVEFNGWNRSSKEPLSVYVFESLRYHMVAGVASEPGAEAIVLEWLGSRGGVLSVMNDFVLQCAANTLGVSATHPCILPNGDSVLLGGIPTQ